MKRQLILLILLLNCLASKAQEIAFSGQLNGIDSTEISAMILPLKQGEDVVVAKIACVHGKFECAVNLNLDMWHLVRLSSPDFERAFADDYLGMQRLKNRDIVFFIQPNDQLLIQATIRDCGIDYQVSGNDINTQRNLFANKLFPLEEEFNRLAILNEKANAGDETERQLKEVSNKIDSVRLSLIANHPDWIYSAEKLAESPLDTIGRYFKTFTPDVQNSIFGNYLSKILCAAQIGSPAPEFTLEDKNGKLFSLADFSGKYVVLDFWGSWCGYCIQGIPRMKACYSKYRDKVEFVSIDCNDSKQAWLKALERYDLNWVNLYAPFVELTDKYGVEGFPTKIIIDKEGKIAFKSIGEGDDFYDKMEEIVETDKR